MDDPITINLQEQISTITFINNLDFKSMNKTLFMPSVSFFGKRFAEQKRTPGIKL